MDYFLVAVFVLGHQRRKHLHQSFVLAAIITVATGVVVIRAVGCNCCLGFDINLVGSSSTTATVSSKLAVACFTE